MCDVAEHAGVGKGTLYRHFPTKEALLSEVIRRRFEELCEIASRAEEMKDPFEAVETALRTTLSAIDRDTGLQFEMMRYSDLHWEGIEEQKAALAATAIRILKRAQTAGAVRSDLNSDDIPMILTGIISTMYFRPSAADWNRHLQLVLAGLRPEQRQTDSNPCNTDPKERRMSVTVGFLVLLEAKPDKADELVAFLEQRRELALAEPLTVDWYAFRINQVTYGILDTFEAEAGREAHQAGEISKAFMTAAPELLANDPDVRPVDLIAIK